MMRIAVYAFSGNAPVFTRLIKLARESEVAIDWFALAPQGHHLDELRQELGEERVCYLYADFNRRYRDRQTRFPGGQAESIWSALLKDKDGYRHLDKDEQLRRAGVIYGIYLDFLKQARPDYVLFPDLEVVDGFLLMAACQELGIPPLYHVGLRFLDGSFFSQDSYESLPPYFGSASEAARQRAQVLLTAFEQGQPLPVWCEAQPPSRPYVPPPRHERVLRALRLAFGVERYHVSEDNWALKLKRNLLPLLNRWRAAYFRLVQAPLFDDVSEVSGQPFVLYALQYTPESSINGLEPYYADQLRAIDALLLKLPGNWKLVVKEHPAIAGVRPTAFYKALRKRPGVLLALPSLNTRHLLRESKAVATVTGTIGLEAYLLGHPCFVFGRNFFSHLCLPLSPNTSHVEFVRALNEFVPATREQKLDALAKLYDVAHPFQLSDPQALPWVLGDGNMKNMLQGILTHLRRSGAAL